MNDSITKFVYLAFAAIIWFFYLSGDAKFEDTIIGLLIVIVCQNFSKEMEKNG